MTANQFKPRFRAEADLDLRGAIQDAIWSQLQRQDIFPFQNCLSCTRFTEATEVCGLYNCRPPVRVLSYGCNKYIDEKEIPY